MAELDLVPGQTARSLRATMLDKQMEAAARAAARRRTARKKAADEAFDFCHHPMTPRDFDRMTGDMIRAAACGRSCLTVMEFPCVLCSDHGRAVLGHAPEWPQTLPCRPRSLYEHWLQVERGRGFHLSAVVQSFSGDIPDRLALVLDWKRAPAHRAAMSG